MAFQSEYAPAAPAGVPLHEAVLGKAAEYGETPALIDGRNGDTITYGQPDAFHRRVAAALTEAGLRQGDVLALPQPPHHRAPGGLLRRHARGGLRHDRPPAVACITSAPRAATGKILRREPPALRAREGDRS